MLNEQRDEYGRPRRHHLARTAAEEGGGGARNPAELSVWNHTSHDYGTHIAEDQMDGAEAAFDAGGDPFDLGITT